MTDDVTPIGTKPAAPPRPKICPMLTMAVMRPQEKSLISAPPGAMPAPPPAMGAIPCLGSDCALFVGQSDPATGKIIGGGCTFTLATVAVSQGVGVLAALLEGYELRKKH